MRVHLNVKYIQKISALRILVAIGRDDEPAWNHRRSIQGDESRRSGEGMDKIRELTKQQVQNTGDQRTGLLTDISA